MQQIGLVLQGGGALGAFEYGAVTRLVEMGMQPTAITGVSIGAINAAAIAGAVGGDINASLHRMWEAITMPEVPWLPPSMQGALSMFGDPNFYTLRNDYFNMANWTSLCSTAPMLATLNKICDFKQINDRTHMRVAVTATDLHTGGPTTFTNHLPHDTLECDHHISYKATLDASHIMASGSLPPGFPATDIKDPQGQTHSFWDGGLFSNTPIDALLDMLHPEEVASLPIYVLDLFPSEGLSAPDNLKEVQNRTMILQYQNRFWAQYGGTAKLEGYLAMLDQLDRELSATSPLRKDIAFQWLSRQRALKNLHVITASAPPMTGGSDFSKYAVQNSREAGRKAVDDHFALLGTDKTEKKLKAVD